MRLPGRGLLAALAAIATTGLGWCLLTPPSLAANAATIVVHVSPSSIVANGTSTATVTANVSDSNGNPAPYDDITFSSSDPGIKFSSTTDQLNGSYTATLTSSTTAGQPTITATDVSVAPPISGSTTLTQTPGPAKTISLTLAPSSIPGDGTSTSTATATVLDANGNRVQSDDVIFSSSDSGESVGQTSNNPDGTYSATVTSSTTSGQATITATDESVSPALAASAALTQTPVSRTQLTASPNPPATNQTVTLLASVTSNGPPPSGSVTFENGGTVIAGCGGVPVSPSNPPPTCHTSFAAAGSPEHLSAIFTPQSGSNVRGSTATTTLTIGPDATTTALEISNQSPAVDASTTYTATVTPRDAGSFSPSGAVGFMDGSNPIPSCMSQPLTTSGESLTATCTVTYAAPGSHSIVAVYSGDANFSTSVSTDQSVDVPSAQIGTTMRWTFFFTPKYTKVLSLVVHQAPPGGSIVVSCDGRGCPFARRAIQVSVPCSGASGQPCGAPGSAAARTVSLTGLLAHRHLRPGARITVVITQPGWIGKHYLFTILAGRGPRTRISCLAPGDPQPTPGC